MIISDYEVMRSAAGYYVGRWCEEDGVWEPYDRISDYFETRDEALVALKSMILKTN